MVMRKSSKRRMLGNELKVNNSTYSDTLEHDISFVHLMYIYTCVIVLISDVLLIV